MKTKVLKHLTLNPIHKPQAHIRESPDGLPTLDKAPLLSACGSRGSGKSMTLSNIGLNLMELGLSVLYVSLELNQDLVANRFDSLITGNSQIDWQDNINDTVQILNDCESDGYGKLHVKYMDSGTNANQVRSYLKEFEIQNGFIPDVLLLDYLDIAGPNGSINGDNVSLKDKYVSEEFRNLANEYQMYFFTASQQNRGAIGTIEPDQSHIAGGLTKANTSDFWFSIIATDEMKADGIIMYYCIKARSSDGTGKSATFTWVSGSSRILNIGDKRDLKSILKSKTINRGNINQQSENHSNGGLNTGLLKLTT